MAFNLLQSGFTGDRGVNVNILQTIADDLSNEVLVEKNIRYFDDILPEIVERGLKKDEWYELYQIINLCEKCRRIVAENLNIFDFSEFIFELRFHTQEKYRDFFIEKFLAEKDFAKIRKFLELDLDEANKWDNFVESFDLKKVKCSFFVKMILDLTKNDLEDKRFKKFLISYMGKNEDLKNYLHERYHDRLMELSLIEKSKKQRINENRAVISIVFLMLVMVLASFMLDWGVFAQLFSLIGTFISIVTSLYKLMGTTKS
jgi:hypothetical protein